MPIPKRFDGSYPWYPSFGENIHKKNHRICDDTLDETEVITRIMFVLNKFHIYDLETIDWNKKFSE
jgi:hypothetical protein